MPANSDAESVECVSDSTSLQEKQSSGVVVYNLRALRDP